MRGVSAYIMGEELDAHGRGDGRAGVDGGAKGVDGA